MSANVTTNTVFEAFIEADKAMKELPAIREELDSTKEALASSNDEVIGLLDKLHASQVALENLKASLSTREAELAHATFRADAVEAKHRALRSILSSGDDSVMAVDGALTANPSEVDHPQSPGPTGSPSSESELESSGQSEPVPTSPSSGDATSAASPDTSVTGQSDLDPTSPTPATNGTSPAPQPENPTSAPGPLSNPSDEGSVSSDPTMMTGTGTGYESAKGEDNLSGKAVGVGVGTETTSSSPPLAFSGQPSTRKPDGMEWGYWIVNGGEAPVWMSWGSEENLRRDYSKWAGHAKAAAE